MNDNLPKKYTSLSQELAEIFEHMDEINQAFSKIEAFVEQEYKNIETSINSEKSSDVSKELQYYMADFLKSLLKSFENKSRLFD